MSTHVKDDPAVREAATREAIDAERDRRAAVGSACTRRTCTVAEAVSLEALAAHYPQVRRVLDANAAVADDLDGLTEDLYPLFAAKARVIVDCVERLRAAVIGA